MCVCVNEENKEFLSAREEMAHHQARHQGDPGQHELVAASCRSLRVTLDESPKVHGPMNSSNLIGQKL
jgi:hypothetical protein